MVHDGEDGVDYGLSDVYDQILLDIILPRMDGISVLKQLRKEGILTPVLMLTAKGEISDRVSGLDSGADDYLPKPFAIEELLARVRALLRRKGDLVDTSDRLLVHHVSCLRQHGEELVAPGVEDRIFFLKLHIVFVVLERFAYALIKAGGRLETGYQPL